MSLVNLIIILLQLCPLGGFKLVRFANELDVQAQRVRGRFGFECALPVFVPSEEYRFSDQHIAEAKDGEKKDCILLFFLLLSSSVSHSASIFKLRL